MAKPREIGFHYAVDQVAIREAPSARGREDTLFDYTFQNFFHPFLSELIQRLNKKSLSDMLDPVFLQGLTQDFFANAYGTLPSQVVALEYFPKQIDISTGGPYSNYNWELLFHIPLTIAVHLGKNQRFAEAQKWFHYIFDPTNTDTSIAPPKRFWKFLRFRQDGRETRVEDILALLSKPDLECTPAEKQAKTLALAGYDDILKHPFQPHVVARTRPIAYQLSVVMKYLDNLIAWGDSLFLQDTLESINEATLRYVLAANILGPRPQRLPERGQARPKTFAQLKRAGLDAMGNALVELEGQFPFDFGTPQPHGGDHGDGSGPLFGIGRTLYFCIPHNDKLLGYWDRVGDRLFKIRDCMNISGVVRQLALFDPPIDPGMLVKAAAAGIDVSSIVSGLNQPVSPVRCALLLQKSLELAGEVRGLGNALLAALEKGDAEHLGLLRQGHEIKLQQLTQEVKFLQWKQAEASTEALLRTRSSALERYRYYQRLLGLTPDGTVAPDTFTLDRGTLLTEDNFDDAHQALVSQFDLTVPVQTLPQLQLAQSSSPSNQAGASGGGQLYLNNNEDAELNTHLPTARNTRLAASVGETIAAVLTFIPEFNVNLHFWGLGASSKVFGGSKLSDAIRIASDVLKIVSAWETDQAGMASKTASYQRRADDWTLQNNLAARELMQLGRQIIASMLAEQVARHEHLNAQTQVASSQEVDQFLRDKFTNEDLHLWMQGEISRLYYEYYRFAFDTARKTERTVKWELQRPELDGTDFIQFNYWDGGRKGLLSGEALYLDVKRLEMAYHDNNKRELEITRHVSLRQLDPLALLNLKVTGTCEVFIPEWLYDRDCPGHYMRRLKSVALSLPSVVGPYTSVSCTLSLLRSTVRTSPLLSNNLYGRQPDPDDRFVDYVGAVQSIVTSSGQNDSGLFETNLRDERFLPFEGGGAFGTWRLQLPSSLRGFDYSTISDAILHVRYTARDGGTLLGNTAVSELRTQLSTAGQSGVALLFSLRFDFPTEWSAFVNGSGGFAFRLRKDHFPYMVQSEALSIDGLELYSVNTGKLVRRSPAVDVPVNLASDLATNGYSDVTFTTDTSVLKTSASQVFLIIRYSF